MEIISDTKEFYINGRTAVAIGKFDGVHIGHQKLLMELAESASAYPDEIRTCVFTFDPAPSVFFGSEKGLLSTRKEKRILFERKGIDILIEYPFDRETADMSPMDFLNDIIVGRMGAGVIAAGSDLSFGKKGEGDCGLLKKFGSDNDIDVRIIDKIRIDLDGEYEVSSTLIREKILKAEMEEAEKLLGIPFFIYGEIEHGNHIGTTLGFPTINMVPGDDKLLPPYGVYTADVIIEGRKYSGLTNIGRKPTISDHEKRGVETYIYGFDKDVYGLDAEVYLKHFCRPEKEFGSLDELKAQLRDDILRWDPVNEQNN